MKAKDTPPLKQDGRLPFGFDLTMTDYISGAWTGHQAHEMEKRMQGAALRSPPQGAMLAVEAELRAGEGLPLCLGWRGTLRWVSEVWLRRVCQAGGSKPAKAYGGEKAWGSIDQNCLWGQQSPFPLLPA